MKKSFYAILFATSMLFAASVEPGDKLAKKQEFTYNAGAAPQSLDPAKIEGTPEGFFARNLFETLLISDIDDNVIPGVAHKWEHSDDFKTWTFHLRKDAKWSNGDPVSAEDFVFAWRRLVDPKTASPYSTYLSYMKLKNVTEIISGKAKPESLGVEAKDAHTLILHLEDPVPYADLLTQFYVLSPVPQKVVEKFGDAWSNPQNIVGNGAFKLQNFVLNEEAVMVKNPHYWDSKTVLLDKITLLQISNESVAFTRYRSGNLDISGFPLELFESVKKDYKDELKIAPALCTYYYEINHEKEPLKNPQLRRALSLALDRNIITEKIMKTGQIPAYTFSPPAIQSAHLIQNPDWASWDMKKRSEEAVKLLKEAGYSKNKPLNLSLLYNTNEGHKQIALAVASIWKKNLEGIVNVKLQNQEWKTFLSTRRLGDYQIARAGWCSDYNEASSFLNIFTTNSSNNQGRFSNAEYDSIIKTAYLAPTEEDRAKAYARAEEILYQESALIPVYFYTNVALIKPYVRGYKIKPSQSYYFKDLYIVEH